MPADAAEIWFDAGRPQVVRPGLLAFGRELGLERTGIQEPGGDAVLRAELQHPAGRDVAPKAHDLGAAQATLGLRAQDRLGVGAATGAKEGDAHGCTLSAPASPANGFSSPEKIEINL